MVIQDYINTEQQKEMKIKEAETRRILTEHWKNRITIEKNNKIIITSFGLYKSANKNQIKI